MPRINKRPFHAAEAPCGDRTTVAAQPRRQHFLQGGIYYGWVLVGALALTEITSWGVLYYSFTVFLKPMQATFGWSRTAMTGAFSLALLISGITGLPVGRWLDRHGSRLLMTIGSCLAALLVLAWAAAGNLVVFYLVWAGIGVVMAAVLYEPAFAVVATWFNRKRGRALTLLTFLAGLASVTYIPLAGFLVQRQGWRGALVILAIIVAVGTIPLHALILRRRPEDMGLTVDGRPANTDGEGVQPKRARSIPLRHAIRGTTFRWLTAAFCLNMFGNVAVTVHLVPYLTDRGFSSGFAAGMAGLVGIMALPGRLILTPLGDRVPGGLTPDAIFLLQALSLLVLLLSHGPLGVAVFVLLFGAGFGAITPARAALVAEFYGAAQYASISAVMMLFVTGARALAPVTAGTAHDLSGGYTPFFWLLVAISTIAAGAVVIAERSAQAVAELDPG